MSTHINAPEGAIADKVLLPGDPLRAKFIAENFLEDVKCYNEVRGMFGFTGIYKGQKVSVQGTGMGQPSLSIYAHELFQFYNVQKAIRIGTCGSMNKDVHVRDLVLGSAACTNSALQEARFGNVRYAPVPDFELLDKAYHRAKELGMKVHVGPLFSSDRFYDDKATWKLMAQYGAIGIEMEAAELYTLAAQFNRKALTICTISDSMVSDEKETTAEERQNSFKEMMILALDTIIADEK